MTSILGEGGDPVFYHGDDWAAEEERRLQIKWEDHQLADGKVLCFWCEQPFPESEMADLDKDGFTWKACDECSGRQDYLGVGKGSGLQYESSPIPPTNALGEANG